MTLESTAGGFTADDVGDQTGKIFLITGANSGIGFETAKVLASKGGRVLMGCRSTSKADEAVTSIRSTIPDADLGVVELDQADLRSVRAAADRIGDEDRLDVLINNAGIMMPPREMTADGFESQFGVNHLGTFALSSLLLPKLADNDAGRIVITSSIAHKGAKIFFDDLAAERRYRAKDRYGQSKLANLLFMYELDRRLRSRGSTTLAVGCHPGIADTELARHLPGIVRFALPLFRPLLNSAAQGAWPTLMAATSSDVESGDYCGPSKRNETAGPAEQVEPSSLARNEPIAEGLWELSIEMTGIDPGL